MKELQITSKVIFCQMDELKAEEKELVERAILATDNSYAPYSSFHVGAAIRLSDGSIVIGANQENAAFPVTLCAERTALFAAQAQHPELAVTQLAVAARNKNGLVSQPVSPCGSCRQVILEIEQRYSQPIKIFLYGTSGVYVLNSVRDLLPLCFVEDSMK